MNNMAEKEEFSEKEDLNLGGLLYKISQTGSYILYSVLVTAGLLLTFFLALFILIPNEQTFQAAVNFTFLKKEKGDFYPNGVRFSLNDLIAPLVLEKVYQDNNLGQKGVKSDDFQAAIRVSPYTPTYKETIARYRARLADRKLTFGEREVIEKAMGEELRAQSQNNGLIQLFYSKGLGLSPALGQKLVTDIPKAWSDISIEQRGVLKMPQEIGEKPLLDEKRLEEYDYPIMLDSLRQALSTLNKQLNELSKIDGAETISDSQSGHTVGTLKQSADRLGRYEITTITAMLNNNAIYKKPDISLIYIKERIFSEKLRQKAILDRMEVITDILEGHGKKSDSGKTVSGKESGVMSQINEGFFNKMVEMIQNSSSAKLQEGLVTEKLKLQDSLSPIRYSIAVLERRLTLLKEYNSKENRNLDSANKDLSSTNKILDTKIQKVSQDLNKYWNILGHLFKSLSRKKYSYSSQLYTNLALESNFYNYHPAKSKKLFILSLAALLLAGLFGMFWGLIRNKILG